MTPERGQDIADALGWIYYELPYGSTFHDWDGERRGWPEALAAIRARNAALWEAAAVARKHEGSAAKARLAKGTRLSTVPDGAAVEIQAEERGEDIAAGIIAAAIEALIKEHKE